MRLGSLPVLSCLLLLGCDPSVVVGYAERASEAGAADAAAEAAVPLPAITWPSGMHPSNEYQGFLDYGAWRGRPPDVIHAYVDRRSWQGLVEPGWPLDILEPFAGPIVLSEPLYPEDGTSNNEDCAAGAYDGEWSRLGTFLGERGRGDAIVRLGWGFNDPVKQWKSDGDPAAWIACFRRVAAAIRSTGPDVRIEWSLNAYASPFPASGDPFDAYPGDDVVDLVGTDIFDADPASPDLAAWQARCDAVYGLCTTFAFARAHGKRAAVGEWGVASCGARPGGDNPFFVEQMVRAFAANADVLEYESYFNGEGQMVCSQIADDTTNPMSGALYKRAYGPR